MELTGIYFNPSRDLVSTCCCCRWLILSTSLKSKLLLCFMSLICELILVLIMKRRHIWRMFLFLRSVKMMIPEGFRMTNSSHLISSKRSINLIDFFESCLIEIVIGTRCTFLKSIVFLCSVQLACLFLLHELRYFLSRD